MKKQPDRTSGQALERAEVASQALTKIVESATDGWAGATSITRLEAPSVDAALARVQAIIKQGEAERDELVKPLTKVAAAIRAKYKPALDLLNEQKAHLKSLLAGLIERERLAEIKLAEKQAKRVEKKGQVELAKDIRAAAAHVAPKVQGAARSYLKIYARVTNMRALCAAIGEGKASELLAFVQPNQPVLDALAKAGAELPPGVERVEEVVIAAGGRVS